jgi:zinc transport system permease protein
MEDFILRALLAGSGVALLAGPLGCFVIWRRMAYFGDTVAHSGLLGVALGLVAGIDITAAVLVTCVVLALLLAGLERGRLFSNDTILGILSHSALALGLVTTSFITWVRFDLMSLLFGNLLAVSLSDLYWIYGGGAFCLAVIAGLWRQLVLVSIGEDIAVAEGVPVERVRFVFMVLIGLVVALAMKIVGIMLITALLIIPAAAVRCFARSPEVMAGLAAIAGLVSVGAGMFASVNADTPPGPSIVLAAGTLFVLSLLWRALVPAISPAGKGR